MRSQAIAPAAVFAARDRQIARNGVLNSEVHDATLRTQTRITQGARALLGEAMKRLGMSARGYTRVLRVAITIADLIEQDELNEEIVAEAVSYRSLDRLSNIIHEGGAFVRSHDQPVGRSQELVRGLR